MNNFALDLKKGDGKSPWELETKHLHRNLEIREGIEKSVELTEKLKRDAEQVRQASHIVTCCLLVWKSTRMKKHVFDAIPGRKHTLKKMPSFNAGNLGP